MMYKYRRIDMVEHDSMYALERSAWGALAAKPNEIRRRMQIDDNCTYGMYHGEILMGSIVYVHVNSSAMRQRKWVEYLKYFGAPENDADCLYIVSLTAHPNAPRGIGRELLLRAKEECRTRGLRFVAYGSRIPGYAEVNDHMSAGEYIREVVGKVRIDPVLSLGMLCSYKYDHTIEDYYNDRESGNYGVLMMCDITNE